MDDREGENLRRPGIGWGAAVLASYVAVFGALGGRWLAASDHAIPVGVFVDPADSRLLAFQLGWIARSLLDDPARLFDAPIFHPAPRQITGTEALLSSQLAFAPVYWATDNATLAASLAAFASYPLAALAMSRLLARLGCGEAVAWVGGLAFALGPLRVPANLQVLQYPNLYLPLAALALTSLRERPDARRAAVVAFVLALGFLASFYLAVMLGVAVAAWGAIELVRRLPHRGRFAALLAASLAAAAVPLAVATVPYLARRESGFDDPLASLSTATGMSLSLTVAGNALGLTGAVAWLLALLGLLALGSRDPSLRVLAWRGAAIAGIGLVLMAGRSVVVGDVQVPLPFDWIARSPARFFRLPWRFVVVAAFGLTLLGAAGLAALVRRAGPGWGTAACAAAAAALVVTRGLHLPGDALDPVPAQRAAIYRSVADATSAEAGPLLELPLVSTAGATAPDAMIGILRHGRPSIDGHTGYVPPHARFVRTRMGEVAAGGEMQDVVDMTRLRWLLLRPAEEWPRPEQRDRILARDDVRRVLSRDGWDLLQVTLPPGHPEWYAAIAAGARPGATALGTPLAPLVAPAGAVQARVEPERVATGDWFVVRADVRNTGDETWPSLLGPGDPKPLGVKLGMRLFREDGVGGAARRPVLEETSFVWRDLPPGERLAMSVPLAAPKEPGRYRLEVWLLQRAGPPFRTTMPASGASILEVAEPEDGTRSASASR